MRHLSEVVDDTILQIDAMAQRGESVTGVPTGYRELDRLLLGFQPGNLIVISARPSMGKTSFALNLALNAAQASPPSKVLYCSLEMDARPVVYRLLSISEGIDCHRLRMGFLTEHDMKRIRKAQESFRHVPIYIEDSPRFTVKDLRAEAWRLKASDGLDMVIIDDLHLIEGPLSSPDRQALDDENNRLLKGFAEELDVPTIVLTQLGASADSRPGKARRPFLSDLRERCSAGQHADVVMLLYRPEYYEKQATRPEECGVMEVIVAKQGRGPIGVVRLRFEADTMRIEDTRPNVTESK